MTTGITGQKTCIFRRDESMTSHGITGLERVKEQEVSLTFFTATY
jgi:hypothetical protein